ncbi:MAG: hypothetical protein ABSF43_08265 [Rectinemataceae bacterium]|jgi:hypothetical protein
MRLIPLEGSESRILNEYALEVALGLEGPVVEGGLGRDAEAEIGLDVDLKELDEWERELKAHAHP